MTKYNIYQRFFKNTLNINFSSSFHKFYIVIFFLLKIQKDVLELECIVEVGVIYVNMNVIEKYFQQRQNSIVNSTVAILNHLFPNQTKWVKDINECTDYYINNCVLNNNVSQKVVRKYYKFFQEYQIIDNKFRLIMTSIFETLIDYTSLNNQISKNGSLLVGRVYSIGIRSDELSNLLKDNDQTPKSIYEELLKMYPEEKIVINALKDSKKELIVIIKDSLTKQKKLNKLFQEEAFQLEFIPYKHRSTIKPLFEVVPKYYIEGLSKYQSKEIEYVIEKENIDMELIFITYTLSALTMIRFIEKEKFVYFMIPIPNKFFKVKKNFRRLMKLMLNSQYSNRIILEIDASILEKMEKDIEKVRSTGTLIAIRNGNPDLSPDDFDCIVISKDQTKIKDMFKRFTKLGQITIISDVTDEEEQRKIDYHIQKDRLNITDIIEK